MRYVFSVLKKVKDIFSSGKLFLFLDCDGTLVPIGDTPVDTVIPVKTKNLLRRLSGLQGVKIAIVSGRALSDIRKRFGLKGLIYSGNHGFQVSGPGIKQEFRLSPGYKALLAGMKRHFKKNLSGIKGIFIEDKGFSLALHFRLVSPGKVPLVKSVFREGTSAYLAAGRIRTGAGKKVLEVKPPESRDKGRMVLSILKKAGASGVLPVYLGDDLTDEDAFKALKGRGFTVFVGRNRRSSAGYYLKDVKEVHDFLGLILEMRKGKKTGCC
ncbi:MAG: trehalose-phosphatase [Candidatus Omnitrophica bacterium]|nr:trehalose-phosphatase [Candidatus Omnitrophota bacterium]MDD5078123.1 trehalose-phosphatase [Candidatus Omnitrophota bacterium]